MFGRLLECNWRLSVRKSGFTDLEYLGRIPPGHGLFAARQSSGAVVGRRAMECLAPVKEDDPSQGGLIVRAIIRPASLLVGFVLAVNAGSLLFAQGTAAPSGRLPAGNTPAPRTGPANAGATGAAPRPATGSSAVRPAGATAPANSAGPGVSTATSAGGSNATLVVVIDIGEVFKNHSAFNQQVEAIKKEMKDLEAWAQTEQKKVVELRAKLADYKPGSPEYKQHEEEMARMASDMQVAATLRQKGIYEQEAKLYFQTYNEILAQVEDFSDRNNIRLVLRHSNTAMDPQKRDTVFRGLERQIIYHRNLDITNEIISRVNRGATTAAAPKAGAAGRTAPGAVRQ